MRTWLLSAIVLGLLGSLPAGAQAPVEILDTPADSGSGMYSLAAGADGNTYLSWLVPGGDGGHVLHFSRFGDRGWGPAIEVARGADWFVNWIDHPSVTAARDGRLFAHLLVDTGRKSGAYGYAVRVMSSADAGRTWQTVFEEGVRNVSDYSGFLTFLPTDGGMSAVYLTPLAPDSGDDVHGEHGGGHVKTVGVVRFGPTGAEQKRTIVDTDACSCCSTDIAATDGGLVAVYRDHEAGEIRDISIVREVDGRWTTPVPVHRDNWKIGGCPTNGPAVAAAGRNVAVAWFTAAGEQARVYAAFSTDGGATFSTPVRVDEGSPIGWPDIAMRPDGRTVVSWLERGEAGRSSLRVRQVDETGPGPVVVVANAGPSRAAGVPMTAALDDGSVLVAWRDERVRTARVRLP